MKIPIKIILFCEEYEIRMVNLEQMKKIDKEEFDKIKTEGLIDMDKRIIYIRTDTASKEIDIFWHEIGHYFANITESQDNEAFAQSFSELVRGVQKQLK